MYEIIDFLAQNPVGPRGADFGKASPVGWLVIIGMLLVVLIAGWDLARRLKRIRTRRAFAERHGMDPFDIAAIDEAMVAEARGESRGAGAAPAAPADPAEPPAGGNRWAGLGDAAPGEGNRWAEPGDAAPGEGGRPRP
ncbi:hypothetical protein [Corynebacterium sphenisci]|uniref:hypothetical protein n=1 Tax=Corynebacterium sphenisci TaxID=191493 RepID=UPI0026E03D5D|nr:hypothetical protein [Corynebacterium sphenisci]MDO5731514.1 hypothetical protein [Corynebacterium sphenisci]